MDILALLSTALLGTGVFFFFGGCLGIIRMPDFYSRLHPAGKLDTMGLMTMVLALALYNLEHFTWATVQVSLKMFLIIVFVFFSSPTATHAILDAGLRAGLVPWTKAGSESGSGRG